MDATQIEIPTADGPLPGLLWKPVGQPEGRSGPGIVVVQEIFGLSDYVRSRCSDLAALGLTVVAPQLFDRLDPPLERIDEGLPVPELLEAGMGAVGALDPERARDDVLAAAQLLRDAPEVDPERVGLIGFCYGGGLAFAAAAAAISADAPPACLVSFYGSALPQMLDLAPVVDVPSLHVFGTEDDFIPLPVVEQVRDAVTDHGRREQVRFLLYEGAGHAFDNPHPAFHHEQASAAAWQRTEQFLAEELASD